jgi:hypothetical protein
VLADAAGRDFDFVRGVVELRSRRFTVQPVHYQMDTPYNGSARFMITLSSTHFHF